MNALPVAASAMLLLALLLPDLATRAHAKIEFDRLSKRIITTKYGKLRGILVEFPGSTMPAVEAYLGVEYGSLLGGSLRFMPPTGPVEKWRGLRLANAFKPVCPQKNLDAAELADELPLARAERLRAIRQFALAESEECLYLNIYVPMDAGDGGERLPVVVFIHGESYEFGTGNAYDGSVLASIGGVIVITLNYRLGPLGFLGGADMLAGNYAAFDIIAALHWIKGNIDDFGGDGERVTLLGQGYGAALAHLIALTPAASGMRLFQRLILQSGSLLCSWAMSNSRSQAEDVAAALNCSGGGGSGGGGGGETAYECLKKAPARTIMNVAVPSLKYTSVFGPTVDGRTVLPRQPIALQSPPAVAADVAASAAAFGKVELLLGVGRFEGLLYLSQKLLEGGVSAAKRKSTLRAYVRSLYEHSRQEIYDILMHQYSDWDAPPSPLGSGGGAGDETDDSIKRMLVEILGDGQYNVPVVRTALAHAAHQADTFLYVFGHSTEQDRFPEWSGGAHGEDLVFAFGAPLADGLSPFGGGAVYTRNERLLSEAVIRMWTNFVKTGNPNFPVASETEIETNRFLDTFWPKYEQRRQEYLYIGMRPAINHHYRGEMVSVWLDLIPKVHHTDRLAPSHHLLRDRDNTSVFDAGAGSVEMWHVALPPPPSPPLPPFRTFFRTNSPASSAAVATTAYVTSSAANTDDDPASRGEAATAVASATTADVAEPSSESMTEGESGTARERPAVMTVKPTAAASTSPQIPTTNYSNVVAGGSKDGEESRQEEGVSLSLTITIGVGCALLFINAFIFVGVYFQKNKMMQERQALKAAAAAAAATPAAGSEKSPQGGGSEALNGSSDQLSLTARSNAIFEAYSRTKEAAAREEKSRKAAAALEEQAAAGRQQPSQQSAGSRQDNLAPPRAAAGGGGGVAGGDDGSRPSSGSSSYGRAHATRSNESDGERCENFCGMNGYGVSPNFERKANGMRARESPPPAVRGGDGGGWSPSPPPTPSSQSGRNPVPREMLIRTPTPRARHTARAAPPSHHPGSDGGGSWTPEPRTHNGDYAAGDRSPARYGGEPDERDRFAAQREQAYGRAPHPPPPSQRRQLPRDGGGSGERYYNDEPPMSDDSYSGDSHGRSPRDAFSAQTGGRRAGDYNGHAHRQDDLRWVSEAQPAGRRAPGGVTSYSAAPAQQVRKAPVQQHDYGPYRPPPDAYREAPRAKAYGGGGSRDRFDDDQENPEAPFVSSTPRGARRMPPSREPAGYHDMGGTRPRFNAGQYPQ